MISKNYISLGPVRIRHGSKHLAKWGFPRIAIGGLSLWTWTNTGQFTLASYHPASSITWLWAVTLWRAQGIRAGRSVCKYNWSWAVWFLGLGITLHRQRRMNRGAAK